MSSTVMPSRVALFGRADRYGRLPDPNAPVNISFAPDQGQAEFDLENQRLADQARQGTEQSTQAKLDAAAKAQAKPGEVVEVPQYVDPADSSLGAAFRSTVRAEVPNPAPRPPTAPVPQPARQPSPAAVQAGAHAVGAAYAQTHEDPRQTDPANPKNLLRYQLPGEGWQTYDATAVGGDPRLRAGLHSPRDPFASSRAGQPMPGTFEASGNSTAGDEAVVTQIGPNGATGGPSETFRTPTKQEALLDWASWKGQRERQEAAEGAQEESAKAAEAGARAAQARSKMLAEEPFLAEEIAAGAHTGVEQIKERMEAQRQAVIRGRMVKLQNDINAIWTDPRYAKATAMQKQQAQDRLMRQAELEMGALVERNLSPRVNPLEDLVTSGGGQQQPKKE